MDDDAAWVDTSGSQGQGSTGRGSPPPPAVTPEPPHWPASRRPFPPRAGGNRPNPPHLRTISASPPSAPADVEMEPSDKPAAAPDGEREQLRFTLPIARGLGGGAAGGGEAGPVSRLSPETNAALREAFTPTRPKQRVNSLFIGRVTALRRIISAVEEERAHVVLFGDRGRGKTSVANAVEQIAAQAGYLSLKLTCSAELTFEDVFRHFLRRIPSSFYRSTLDNPFVTRRTFANFNELLPDGNFSVTELNEVLAGIHGTHILLVLDEYDRVTDDDLRNKLAELVKNLTDSAIPVTLLIVGVAENLDQLLGKHPSIQRSLVPVHLPLMQDREIELVVQAGASNAGLVFPPDVVGEIVAFARGLPYYAQLLGLHTARHAVARGARTVTLADLAQAVTRCLHEAERGIIESYSRALAGERRALMEGVLRAVAQCPTDDFGSFGPDDMADVPEPDGGVMSRERVLEALDRLTQDDHASVLLPVVVPGACRYRFRNQMMRQYVLMRGARETGRI